MSKIHSYSNQLRGLTFLMLGLVGIAYTYLSSGWIFIIIGIYVIIGTKIINGIKLV